MLLKKSQDKTSEHDKLTNDANSDDAVDKAVHYNKSNDDNDSAHNDNNNHRFFIPNSKYSTIVIYALLFVVGTILIYKFIGTFNQTMHLIGSILNLISPFIVGAFIAFILFPLVKLLFRKLFKGVLNMKSDKAAKYLSITTAYIIAIGAITILLVFVIPQIYESITEITEQLPVWYNSALEFVGNFENNHQNLGEYVDFNMINERIETALPNIFNYLTGIMSNLIPVIFSTGMAIVKGIISFIISIAMVIIMSIIEFALFLVPAINTKLIAVNIESPEESLLSGKKTYICNSALQTCQHFKKCTTRKWTYFYKLYIWKGT